MNRLSMMMILLLGSTMIAFAWSFSDYTDENMVWNDMIVAPSPYASCLAWGDINGDGAIDLFVGSQLGNHCQLFLNDGEGRFADVSNAWDVGRFYNVKSAQFVDYDRDGHLDLFLLTDNNEPLELYRQTAITRLVRVDIDLSAEEMANINSVVWNDLDSDGQLDMMVNAIGDDSPEITILEFDNNAMTLARDTRFPEGISNIDKLSLIDYNRDGRLDFLAGSASGDSKFYLNNGSEYREISDELHLAPNVGASGAAWADFNHDSYLDFATCGSYDETYLYMGAANERRLVFEDHLRAPHTIVAPHPLMRYIEGATSVHAIDANMDGWTDLFYVNAAQGNALLINEEGQRWRYDAEINAQLNHGDRAATAAAWGDIDGDGDLDLALTYDREGLVVLRNNVNIEHEYVNIRIASRTTETPILNCQLVAKFEGSQQLWATTSMANSSVGRDDIVCQFINPTREHSRAFELSVHWPSGAISRYSIDDVQFWSEMTLRPPSPTSDGDTNPDTFLEPVPVVMAKLENSPNPFNPTTTLNYVVPEAGWVELSVMNVLGQEVMSLVSGHSDAGNHSVHFNASGLPSGMYIARLNAAGQTALHRMILTK